MKVNIIWYSPNPEKIIAIAMRRCYSTKPLEEIISELETKGNDYLEHLLRRAFDDKALDVIEHFRMELLVEDIPQELAWLIVSRYPFSRWLRINEGTWLAALNARTLVEMWRDADAKGFAKTVVDELIGKSVCNLFVKVAFGDPS